MKTFLSLLAFSFFGLLSPVYAASGAVVDPMNLPKLTEYVEDFSDALAPADLTNLRQTARDYEAKTTNQMVVVLIPNRNGNELFDIGMKIFNSNQIGQKGKDNGILLIIATDEKKIRIVTGYGLEGDIPDVLASDFIEKSIRPLVNEGKYQEAIRAFFDRTSKAIGTDEGKKAQEAADEEGKNITSAMAFIFGLIFSFNIYFLIFAAIFFIVISFSIGSIGPIAGFLIGMVITLAFAFLFAGPSFRKTFFEAPKSNGGSGGSGSGWGSGSSGGGGFSGGGGSSGGGGAGD
ncbi:MAG: TPM domain-containing protein [Candidatus Gracilibacteria bacterium]|nr:TPM domain-containing protein [Candidatus Gracilibacteria bacterium]